jgi:hypothetical protein
MLRDAHYADAMLLMAGPQVMQSGTWFANAGQGREAMVWRDDCIASAVAVLTTAGHENRIYNITGPHRDLCRRGRDPGRSDRLPGGLRRSAMTRNTRCSMPWASAPPGGRPDRGRRAMEQRRHGQLRPRHPRGLPGNLHRRCGTPDRPPGALDAEMVQANVAMLRAAAGR